MPDSHSARLLKAEVVATAGAAGDAAPQPRPRKPRTAARKPPGAYASLRHVWRRCHTCAPRAMSGDQPGKQLWAASSADPLSQPLTTLQAARRRATAESSLRVQRLSTRHLQVSIMVIKGVKRKPVVHGRMTRCHDSNSLMLTPCAQLTYGPQSNWLWCGKWRRLWMS